MKNDSPTPRDGRQDTSDKSTRMVLLIPAGIAVAMVVGYLLVFKHGISSSNADWGTFGDYFGGVLNPVIAGCTLFVAASVWRLQKRELKVTQVALQEQAKTAEQQRGEQRFFDLFRIYESTLDSISFAEDSDPNFNNATLAHQGKKALYFFLTSHPRSRAALLKAMAPKKFTSGDINSAVLEEEFQAAPTRAHFGHYFRVVFRILSDAEDLVGKDQYRYVKLFRAQLSLGELFMIAFNLAFNSEGKQMIGVVKKYGLLKHLSTSPLRSYLEANMPPEIFGAKFVAKKASAQQAPAPA